MLEYSRTPAYAHVTAAKGRRESQQQQQQSVADTLLLQTNKLEAIIRLLFSISISLLLIRCSGKQRVDQIMYGKRIFFLYKSTQQLSQFWLTPLLFLNSCVAKNVNALICCVYKDGALQLKLIISARPKITKALAATEFSHCRYISKPNYHFRW